MYVSGNILYLFDWELSQNEIPMMIDVFHFVFQSQTMINHGKYTEIFTELNQYLKMQSVQELVRIIQLISINTTYFILFMSYLIICLNI